MSTSRSWWSTTAVRTARGTAVAGLADSRVALVRHPQSRGVSAARNTGIETASAPWLAFVDDDDLWAPRKLRSQLDAVAAQPEAQWSCTGTVNIDEECRLLWWTKPPCDPDIGDAMLVGNVVPGGGSSVLASRELTTAVGGFDEDLSNLADWDFYTRLALRSLVAAVSRPLVGYYVHRAGMAHNARRSKLEYPYVEVKYAPERGAEAGDPRRQRAGCSTCPPWRSATGTGGWGCGRAPSGSLATAAFAARCVPSPSGLAPPASGTAQARRRGARPRGVAGGGGGVAGALRVRLARLIDASRRLRQPPLAGSSMQRMLPSLSLNHAALPISGMTATSPRHSTPGMSS